MVDLDVRPINAKLAREVVEREHYLHRKPGVRYAFGLFVSDALQGVVTFGCPASNHLLRSVCPTNPAAVIELNRLWVHDDQPRNTESQFVGHALRALPPLIVVSYADTAHGHTGYIYRALNFNYAGWTDMERKSPRCDYIPSTGGHSRSSFRGGQSTWTHKVPRLPKVKYWIVTGNRTEQRHLRKLCAWPSLNWRADPPPTQHQQRIVTTPSSGLRPA